MGHSPYYSGVVAALGALLLAAIVAAGCGISKRNREKGVKVSLYLSCSLCLIWPIVNLAVHLAAPDDRIWLGTLGSPTLLQRAFDVLAFFGGVLLAAGRFRKTEKKPGNFLALGGVVSLLAVLLLLTNGVLMIGDDSDYYRFTSPDQKDTILVSENSFLQAGWVSVYQRVNPFVVRLRDTRTTDDGYRPIGAGNYAVQWEERQVVVSFGDGMGGRERVTVPLE